MKEAIEAFILGALKDAAPTVKTNPLLWWLAFLVQTEVIEPQPRVLVDGLVDTLDFYAKLEALDHYSRVLLLDHSFRSWCYASPSLAPKREWVQDVVTTLDRVSIHWIDEDKEPPSSNEDDRNLTPNSPGWIACLDHIVPILDDWLGETSAGPMREITRLRRRIIPDRVQEVQNEELESNDQLRYKLMVQIVEGFTSDAWINDCYPMVIATIKSLEFAKAKALSYIKNEFGRQEDAYRWEEVTEDVNMFTIRAIYMNMGNDAKVTVWTEKIPIEV
jgi:hypothetical protein